MNSSIVLGLLVADFIAYFPCDDYPIRSCRVKGEALPYAQNFVYKIYIIIYWILWLVIIARRSQEVASP